MRLARYFGGGRVEIVDEPVPACPDGGLLVRTEASGLCSGELMDWYMDQKIPHVLGHEVAGIVVESQDDRFPVGARIFPHHHAPCLNCEFCDKGLYVHCGQWRRTKLDPGGMAEFFAVSPENLSDTFLVDDLRPVDAALIEPLGCVVKSLRISQVGEGDATAVIGIGVMGLLHALLLPNCQAYELSQIRRDHAKQLGIDARPPEERQPADVVFVCPGSKSALDFAIEILRPGGTIVLFAPMPPGQETPVNLNRLYFLDARLVNAYSCGPDDTRSAAEILRSGQIRAEQVISNFIGIQELPEAYLAMKRGDILKPMVVFE